MPECVYCDFEGTTDQLSEHHTGEHSGERYDPAWYLDGDNPVRKAQAVDVGGDVMATIPMDVVRYDDEAFERIANELRQQDQLETSIRTTRLLLDVRAGEPITVLDARELPEEAVEDE